MPLSSILDTLNIFHFHSAYTWAFEIVFYYPIFLAGVCLVSWGFTRMPARFPFLLREVLALTTASVLAHLNRWFLFYPVAPYLVSGHMTFALGVSLSLGLLCPWTLLVTMPLMVPFGYCLVVMGFHNPIDVDGAILLVLVVYGLIHWLWKVPAPEPARRAREFWAAFPAKTRVVFATRLRVGFLIFYVASYGILSALGSYTSVRSTPQSGTVTIDWAPLGFATSVWKWDYAMETLYAPFYAFDTVFWHNRRTANANDAGIIRPVKYYVPIWRQMKINHHQIHKN